MPDQKPLSDHSRQEPLPKPIRRIRWLSVRVLQLLQVLLLASAFVLVAVADRAVSITWRGWVLIWIIAAALALIALGLELIVGRFRGARL